MLKQRVDMHSTDGEGRTPLHYAARAGAGHAVWMLLNCSANPNATDRWGATPVDEAEYWSVKHLVEGDGPFHSRYTSVLDLLHAYGGKRSELQHRKDAPQHIKRLQRLERLAEKFGVAVPWRTATPCGGCATTAPSPTAMPSRLQPRPPVHETRSCQNEVPGSVQMPAGSGSEHRTSPGRAGEALSAATQAV